MQAVVDSDNEICLARTKEVQMGLVVQSSQQEDGHPENNQRPGELYKRYRKADELPEHAKAFYQLTGESNLNMKT